MPVFYTVIMYVWVYEQYKIYHFKNFIKKIANCIYSSIPWEKSKQPHHLFLLILSSNSFLKKLMYIVSHCMIILHYICLFFCCQIFLECSQIFIIVNSTAVYILIPYVCLWLSVGKDVSAELQVIGCEYLQLQAYLSVFLDCARVLYSHRFTFPPTLYQWFCWSASSPILGIIKLWNFWPLVRYKVITCYF